MKFKVDRRITDNAQNVTEDMVEIEAVGVFEALLEAVKSSDAKIEVVNISLIS